MVHPNRGVVSHAVNVKQEQEEISLLSAQVTGRGGRRTASLQTKGRMIQLKLKIIYNETQNKDKDVVVVLNQQYPPKSDKNGSFRGHDEEFSSYMAGNKPLELYDEDGDKVDGASFSGVTKGSFLKFEDHMYAVVEVVVDSTPFEKETATATSQEDLATGSLLNADAVAIPGRLYRQTFKGKIFGLQLVEIDGRIVVNKNVTGSSKPAIGDVLFKVNDCSLSLRSNLYSVRRFMRHCLIHSGGAELTFSENPRL
ncbi:hypothetical protein FRACYDRAFT_245714 [Fragilariopsis cylindrus CCMP1102]|uniref:Uncharacterized protein n=1 Tax=Fragilariopsis cylindrus CCMP1102 TaxID=635003 RepID=A0A1E7EZW2_9STRA|nr:hypothetical protein FRACYDRAFT_245714 [Fragilariopsis cylindrus CCMP1102]|eukprot:OEU11354.1 hypothetical protein FRACYDRAFT_245714 [Fragilariopsis cylindrus CCMP1102]